MMLEDFALRAGLHMLLRSIDAALVGFAILALVRAPFLRRRVPSPFAHAALWTALLLFFVPRTPFEPVAALPAEAAVRVLPPLAITSLQLWTFGLVYALGVFWIGGTLLRQSRRLRRWQRDSSPADTPVSERLAQLMPRTRVRILLHHDVPTPMAVGVRTPTIWLPAYLPAQLRDEELDDILAHELTHLLSRDPLWNLLSSAALALWWFHPAVWMLVRELRESREQCCDAVALHRFERDPRHYARTLLRASELSVPASGHWLSASVLGDGSHPMSWRLRRIANGRSDARRLPLWSWFLAASLLTSFWLTQSVRAVHDTVPSGERTLYIHTGFHHAQHSATHSHRH